MMNADPFDVPYPGATIHWLAAHGAPSRVEVRGTDNAIANLTLIVGDGRDPAHIEAARRIARMRAPQSLCLAVMACTGPEQERVFVGLLEPECDAVVAAAPDRVAASAEALCDAILTPLLAGHPWCFDWNDMRELCAGSSSGTAARVFVARARGEGAAAELAERWLIGSTTGPRRLLVGVGLPELGQLARHHDIMRALAARGFHAGPIGSGIRLDTMLASDEVALTVADFGPAHVTPASAPADTYAAPALSDLPEFLRRG